MTRSLSLRVGDLSLVSDVREHAGSLFVVFFSYLLTNKSIIKKCDVREKISVESLDFHDCVSR